MHKSISFWLALVFLFLFRPLAASKAYPNSICKKLHRFQYTISIAFGALCAYDCNIANRKDVNSK